MVCLLVESFAKKKHEIDDKYYAVTETVYSFFWLNLPLQSKKYAFIFISTPTIAPMALYKFSKKWNNEIWMQPMKIAEGIGKLGGN